MTPRGSHASDCRQTVWSLTTLGCVIRKMLFQKDIYSTFTPSALSMTRLIKFIWLSPLDSGSPKPAGRWWIHEKSSTQSVSRGFVATDFSDAAETSSNIHPLAHISWFRGRPTGRKLQILREFSVWPAGGSEDAVAEVWSGFDTGKVKARSAVKQSVFWCGSDRWRWSWSLAGLVGIFHVVRRCFLFCSELLRWERC